MKALVKNGRSISLQAVPRPVFAEEDVLIRVVAAGLCRTDLYAAEGRLACRDPLILGHEFAGVVQEVGSPVRGLALGDRVTAMPVLSCRACAQCAAGAETTCLRPTMLGIDHHGAFAEFVAVPARSVYRVPNHVSFKAAAYAEPVAAALAVLNAGIQPQGRGLIYGSNRFALLIRQVLAAHGFGRVSVHDPARGGLEANAYDFIIETLATTKTLAEIIRAARPFGTIVLKSRPPRPVGIDLIAAVRKELTFRAVHYGPFSQAVALLAEERIDVSELLGPSYPLEAFEHVFALARQDESSKPFFAIAD
jgi:L-iditol 2-dehydrogenase